MPEPRLEGELIALFKDGNRKALQHIYDLHYKTLCYFANKLIMDQPQAEDIVADSYVKLWNLRGNFDTLVNIRAFLYITVRNACFNFLRQAKRITTAQQEMLYLLQTESEQIEFQEIEASLLDKIYAEIEVLPKQCREVFKLFYLAQMNTTEIAQHMKLSRNTVQNHKIRATKLLRTAFLKKNLLPVLVLCSSLNKFTPYYAAGLATLFGFS
jgi:RNA polymerase sigma-70 factor (ECF subfamily)